MANKRRDGDSGMVAIGSTGESAMTGGERRAKTGAWSVLAWLCLVAAGVFGAQAAMAQQVLYQEDFESNGLTDSWKLTGDWRFKTNSACLPNEFGYVTPVTALVFDYGSECGYRSSRGGLATMNFDITIPIVYPSVKLEWWDYVGAELGSDFYFIDISTDGGATWQELFRNSESETFWDIEEADLTPFVGETIRLRFGFTADDTFTNVGWYIDNVRIVAETLGTSISAVAITDAEVVEGNAGTTNMQFELQIQPPSANEITLERATVNGTAFAGLDYVAVSGPLTIPPNTTSMLLEVAVIGDPFFEADETFDVVLSNPSSNAVITIARATGTIINDETPVCGYEEDFEQADAQYIWSAPFASIPANPLTGALELWHIQDATTGCSPEGFSSGSRALVFNLDGTCTYYNPAGYSDLPGSQPVVEMTSPYQMPGVGALTAQLQFSHFLELGYNSIGVEPPRAYVEISRDAGVNWDVLAEYGPDVPSPANYQIGWTQETINISEYVDDSVLLRFRFQQDADLNATTAKGWYVDDVRICHAPRPNGVSKVIVSDSDPADMEGNFGSTPLSFEVQIVPPSPEPITLSISTAADNGPNAATPDEDFLSTSRQIVIPANTSSTTIEIFMLGDDQPEPDETFKLLIANVTPNAFIVREEAIGTIRNDDAPSTFTISPTGPFNEATAGRVTFTATIHPARSQAISVNYRTIDGTAVSGPGLDFEAASGTITFPANVTTATFDVVILNDDQYEDPNDVTPAKENEEFQIEFSSTSPFATPLTLFDIEIEDDELVALGSTVTIDDVVVSEGSCDDISSADPCGKFVTASFKVHVQPPNGSNISLDYKTIAVTATEGVDYIGTSGTLVILPGETEATITVQVQADRAIEGDERFDVVLSNPVGQVNVKDNRGRGIIQDDDFLGTAFGTSGTVYRLRNLDETTPGDPRNLSQSVNLTEAAFRAYNFDTLYGFDTNKLLSINLVSGIVTTVSDLSGTIASTLTALAWDHTNSKAFAATATGLIYEINLTTGTATLAANTGANIVAMAIHPTTGRMYVIAFNAGVPQLATIIPGQWSLRDIRTLNITPGDDVPNNDYWDLDFNDRSQELYLNAYVENGGADRWITFIVDITDGSLNVSLIDPPVSPLAIASSPTPAGVEWTTDLASDSTAPSGLHLLPADLGAGNTDVRVAGVGDVSGDTFEDVLISAPQTTVNGLANAGRSWLIFGSPDQGSEFISDILTQYHNNAASLDAAVMAGNGVIINGSTAGQRLGLSLSGLNDVNGDTIPDFALGFTDASSTGGVLLVYGDRNFPASFSYADVASGAIDGVQILGANASDNAGFSVAGAGDMNGDGIYEIIIGAPNALNPLGERPGAAYIVFGSASGIGTNRVLQLGAMTGPRGFTIRGEGSASLPNTLNFGYSVSGAGDINGDGMDDVVVGAPGASPASTGAVYGFFGHVDYGKETDVPASINLALLNVPLPSPGVGSVLSFTPQLPIATQLAETIDPSLGAITGQAARVPGLKIVGQAGGFGAAIAGLGDVNGDALDDFGVAAPEFNGAAVNEPHWGRIYVVYGYEGFQSPLQAGTIGTSQLAGTLLTGIDQGDLGTVADAERIFGGAGDVNGDGLMDIIVGAKQGSSPANTGETYIVYGGKNLPPLRSLRDLANATEPAAAGSYLVAKENTTGFVLGSAVSAAGDVNNDGIMDYVTAHAGGAYLIYGKAKQTSSTFLNRIRSGKSNLTNPPGGGTGVDLGSQVYRAVGSTGDGSHSKPVSRVAIQFTGGGFGSALTEASTQRVTIYRDAAPDLEVGDGGAEDDARWTPAGVYWAVETDRSQFTKSTIEFYYRPEEVAGLNLDRVGVFYAKNTGPLTGKTAWSWLPFTHDPDRRVFEVSRTHSTDPQAEFNGYYALVQADLVTQLGSVIPSVGVTNDNVYAFGPEVFPSDRTFWHQRDKKLYATAPGEVTIRWRDGLGNQVSEVKALNVWPADNSPLYQLYVAGSPGVLLTDTTDIAVKYTELRAKDTDLIANAALTSRTIEDAVVSDKVFVGDLKGTNPETTARAFLMLSDDAAPAQGSIYFQFVRTVRWNGSIANKGGANGVNWNIGTIIDATTNPQQYGQFHDELAGAPWLLFPNAPVAPATERYPGFYDRDTRSGSIVPVNKKLASNNDDLVLVFYQRGGKLLDARTGAPLRNANQQPVPVFNWPHASAKYNLQWPADAPKIVIARQDGSGEIDVATYGDTLDIYFQNNPSQRGFNPNEEHAVIVPFRAGKGVFALRDDLNAASTSEPYVLMTYYDPNDLTVANEPRAKMKAFKVQKTDSFYVFGPWPDNLDNGADPYEGEAGAFINAPFPISNFGYSPDNEFKSGPAWEDKNARHWASAAGDIVMKFYYPVHPDFYFPQQYINKYPNKSFVVGGSDVPWLDGGIQDLSNKEPIDVTYRTSWPANVPTMKLGEILIDAKFGLPQINGQCSVDFLFPKSGPPRAKLIDPTIARKAHLAELPAGIETAIGAGGVKTFPGLPPASNFRLSYNEQTQTLEWKGILVEPTIGDSYVLINVISPAEEAAIRKLSTAPEWGAAINELVGPENATNRQFGGAGDTYDIKNSTTDLYDTLALTTGDAQSTGYVTIAFQNADACGALPVSLQIIEVVADLDSGAVAVVNPSCVFEEKLTLMQTADFGGEPQNFEMQWLYLPDEDGTIPDGPDPDNPTDPWTAPFLVDENGTPVSASGVGLNQITVQGPGLLTLTDNWFSMRYRRVGNQAPWGDRWSEWTRPQLAPGWIKRVVGEINPFTQRASGGGIEGAEASFATFGAGTPNTIVSMLSQAGPRYTGSIPLNCNDLDSFGLIPIYETVLDRGATLSIDSLSPIDNPGVNTALLLVASRISDLYMLLGNEAYADAQDPTIGFGTDDGIFGAEATSIHPFMNQTSSLLEEELALLRGRDDRYAPGTQLAPVYNRLVWNFTTDFTGGEVAYALNYNIHDGVDQNPQVPEGSDGTVESDGRITEADAARLYPQGHGDAWGHYLKAMKTYYKLLRHPFYTWANRSEAVLVGGAPVTVDFIDERKFAKAAAAKSKTGAEIVNLAYRDVYSADPDKIWHGYKDSNPDRKWGFAEWASRAGQGAYIDWVVGNAILRATDPDPGAEGITKIDRTTVDELNETAAAFEQIQARVDEADLGQNPLGLGTNVVPFDISPTAIDDGATHFEQIYTRAVTAMQNATTVFDYANNSTQALRRQNDSVLQFQRAVLDSEIDFNSRLIEIFGYPYPEDIGPGGTYPTGYAGPDLYHYMYADPDPVSRDSYFKAFFSSSTQDDNGITVYDSTASARKFLAEKTGSTEFANRPGVVIGPGGGIQITAKVKNYLTNLMANGTDNLSSAPTNGILPSDTINVTYNFRDTGGRFGLAKPTGWTERRAPGQLQLSRGELQQALGNFIKAVDSYGGYVDDIQGKVDLLQAKYNLNAERLRLKNKRFKDKKTVQDVLMGIEVGQFALRTAAQIAEKVSDALQESVPTVTGIIVGFSNGVIIDGLSAVRGGLKGVGTAIVEGLKILADAAELAKFRLEQEESRKDDQLEIDIADLEQKSDVLEAIKDLESALRNESTLRMEMHLAYEALIQASGEYQKTLAEGQRIVEDLDRFRKQTSADVQSLRYRDMAFRIFRNDALQKYRGQFDMAQKYVYLAAKTYDYETTLLSSDQRAGRRFLTDIVKARQIGVMSDGSPQTGAGLAHSMAIMARNFETMSSQLGFNNPQVETNRFSLRYEKFRILPGQDGDENWRTLLNGDYFQQGEIGRVDNLWELPEFQRYCVPPVGFGSEEPGLVISFAADITEGYNFFGNEAGGQDSSYDATQFATKIRSVGVWFSNYNQLQLSNTPRVYLVPVGTDVLRSPTGFRGEQREFVVLDQVIPEPFPIGANELNNPLWLPQVDTVNGAFQPIRRFGRFRAFHDSGEFSIDEMQRDSRLIGRSVWNKKWMLIIPASTLGNDREEALETLINGRAAGVGGERDGNGISDIKLFFETYAYPRLKK